MRSLLHAVISLLLAVPALSLQNQTADKKCALSGRVTNALTGEPIRKAAVHLRLNSPVNSRSAISGYGGASESDGSFRFEGIDPGEYTLYGDHAGFLNTQYGSKGAYQSGTKLTLAAGQQMSDLNLALIPAAVITGRILDQDGDPVVGAAVQVLKQNWSRGKLGYQLHGGAQTNDLGEYRLSRLPAGKYYLYTQGFEMHMPGNELPAIPGKPDVRQVRTFFPDATSIENATPIQLRTGQEASGMDVRMQRVQTYHVRGRVMGNAGKSNPEQMMVNVSPRVESMWMFGSSSNIKKDLTFDLSGIAPGAYNLNAVTVDGGRGRSVAQQPIDVGAGDLNDVVLTLVAPGTLLGHVRLEGGNATADAQAKISGRMFLSPVEQSAMISGAAEFGADGTFRFEDMSPGRYYSQVLGGPDGTYLKAIRLGQQDVLGKELDFSGGVSGELEVVFSYGAAEVNGTIRESPGAQIALAPEVLNADGSGIHFANTDQNGVFSVKGLAPGHYRAYAFQQIDTQQFQNPDLLKALESKATEIDLRENDKKQIQLTPIPAEDMQQIFSRLGIEVQQ